jgi:excisionase family DNA binding protein
MSIRETYVRVQEAAKILGVAPNTVRAWGAAGKIPEFRHPVNGHRLYRRDDLAKILQQIEQTPTPVPRRKP